MNRKDLTLQCIDITKGHGLEIGPLFSPLVSKDEAKVLYIDHMSTDDLKKKYKDHEIPLDSIVPIDYVLTNNSLKESVAGKKFDYVIASHVIEHIPDMVRWLADVASILKEGGILSLVIPDKRFTFDIQRNESRPADVIGAYLDRHTRASSATMYDYISQVQLNIDPAEVWRNPWADYSKKPIYSLEETYKTCLDNLKEGVYVDSHCFVFTPYSFFEIIRALIKHDLFGYEVAYFHNTPQDQIEFYVSLRKAVKSTAKKRQKSVPELPKPTERRELEKQVERLKAELHHLTASKSWKVTQPARNAIQTTKRLRRK